MIEHPHDLHLIGVRVGVAYWRWSDRETIRPDPGPYLIERPRLPVRFVAAGQLGAFNVEPHPDRWAEVQLVTLPGEELVSSIVELIASDGRRCSFVLRNGETMRWEDREHSAHPDPAPQPRLDAPRGFV